MNPQALVAGLRLQPVEGRRHRYTPPGVLILNETWAAAAVCCEPGCGWSRTHRSAANVDLPVIAKNHAETYGHQTLTAWYAADRYVPDPAVPPLACLRPGTAPPSDSEPRARHDAHPHTANSRKTNTTARSTK